MGVEESSIQDDSDAIPEKKKGKKKGKKHRKGKQGVWNIN